MQCPIISWPFYTCQGIYYLKKYEAEAIFDLCLLTFYLCASVPSAFVPF